ncbi:MAG TPA: hypothetical protein P5229_04610, partial [Candidatus Gracilibacteria bacterium]|nr:hypothetical protein [Candidatus Gracilibacteria bacterium]
VCQNFTRSYLRHLVIEKEILGLHLLSYHNIAFLTQLVEKLKKTIGKFIPGFCLSTYNNQNGFRTVFVI